jgi:hypothetical protein
VSSAARSLDNPLLRIQQLQYEHPICVTVPLQERSDQAPAAEDEIKAALRPNEHNEEDFLSAETTSFCLHNQGMQEVAKHSTQTDGKDAEAEHKPPRPPPLTILLPKALNQLHLLWCKVHGVG